jgi:hypothetical protein
MGLCIIDAFTKELEQIVRQAQLIFINAKLRVSTLFLGHLQAFIQLSLQMLCMLGSHHVHINKMLKIT